MSRSYWSNEPEDLGFEDSQDRPMNALFNCECCEEEIYEGDDYYYIPDVGRFCNDCVHIRRAGE